MDNRVYAGRLFLCARDCVGQSGLFFHGQGIHVSTGTRTVGTGAIFHQRDDACALHSGLDFSDVLG